MLFPKDLKFIQILSAGGVYNIFQILNIKHYKNIFGSVKKYGGVHDPLTKEIFITNKIHSIKIVLIDILYQNSLFWYGV